MEHTKEFEKFGYTSIVAYSGKDITDEMIRACFKIDEEFYEQEFAINESEIKEIIEKYGQMCFVLVDTDTKMVIGYSYWIPMKSDVLLEFLRSKEMLLNLKLEYCADFNEPEINLFQEGEAFVVGYDIKELHSAIKELVHSKILKLAQRGTLVKCIAIESICQYDEKILIPSIGLKTKLVKKDSVFYCDKYSPKTMFTGSKYTKELLEYYKD